MTDDPYEEDEFGNPVNEKGETWLQCDHPLKGPRIDDSEVSYIRVCAKQPWD